MRQRHFLWLGFAGAATTAGRLAAWALRRTHSAALPLEWPTRERRTSLDRRTGADRRVNGTAPSVGARIAAAADRRSSVERRSGSDRRSTA